MATTKSVKVPLARVWSQAVGGTIHRTLAWGDRLEFVKREGKNLIVETMSFDEQPDGSVTAGRGARLHPPRRGDDGQHPGTGHHKVLAVDFVDVQQGDAAVVESPKGAVMLIDGGESQLFARYLANRFGGIEAAAPREIDTIVVSHGDADHFAGLPKILDSEGESRRRKRLFIDPRRVYHNGLAKGPSALHRGRDVRGDGATSNGRPYIVDLVDDLRPLPDGSAQQVRSGVAERRWQTYGQRAQAAGKTFVVERLERGGAGKFPAFAAESIKIDVLAPITVTGRHAGRPEAGAAVPEQAPQGAVIGRREHVRIAVRVAHDQRPLGRAAADLRQVPDPVHGRSQRGIGAHAHRGRCGRDVVARVGRAQGPAPRLGGLPAGDSSRRSARSSRSCRRATSRPGRSTSIRGPRSSAGWGAIPGWRTRSSS